MAETRVSDLINITTKQKLITLARSHRSKQKGDHMSELDACAPVKDGGDGPDKIHILASLCACSGVSSTHIKRRHHSRGQ